MSKFLTYWSLTFAILFIWIFSVAVAMADIKDEVLGKIQKQWAARQKARARPVDPLADQSVAETLRPAHMDDKESWVFHLVSGIAIALRLNVRILVLQDSMGHYLVHFAQGKRLMSYRVDKAWVADAMAGKADQRERIMTAVEQYLRQEFLGEKPAPKVPAPAAAKAPAAPAAASPAGGQRPTPAPAGSGGAPASPAAPPSGSEMSREEKIAAARAKAEAMMAQRAAGGPPPPSEPATQSPPPTPAAGTPPQAPQAAATESTPEKKPE
jgi:hypothetical protein